LNSLHVQIRLASASKLSFASGDRFRIPLCPRPVLVQACMVCSNTAKGNNMAIRIVRLGTPRIPSEGLRIGTVRRPPRGVPKSEFASGNWFDVWFPVLAPSLETMKLGQAATTATEWNRFAKKYRAEMSAPDARHTIALLAALSHQSNFSVGCYCADESHCHRSLLRTLLGDAGARLQ
jgi:uncharacterized protein YeaO (DUF488 family)